MKLYDISQEVFASCVFPGDPAPLRQVLSSIEEGAVCHLTAFSMCAHNGTHVDAPLHFVRGGETVDKIPLSTWIGPCFVAEGKGEITEDGARRILRRAARIDPEAVRRILLKGPLFVSEAAARVFAEGGVLLLGNESQTVGPEDAPRAVHLILLSAGLVLLEGVRLSEVPEGVYLLHAAPLNLGGAEGAPCRATLTDLSE